MVRMGSLFLIAGSLVFLVGAQLGVPQVFLTPDANARRRLLEQHTTRWRFAQPLYVAGPVLTSAGVALLAAGTDDNLAVMLLATAAMAMFLGSGTWSYSCSLRGERPTEFAMGQLPGWPFTVYVLSTIAGLALLAGGLFSAGHSLWLGWPVTLAEVGFLTVYVRTRDIPPFVFYILLLAVGTLFTIDPSV